MALLLAAPAGAEWANGCGDGRFDAVVEGFEETAAWSLCCTDRDLPQVTLSNVEGCSGRALRVGWDLRGGDWIVLIRNLPAGIDLRPYSHLRLAFRGTNLLARQNLQLKLVDGAGRVFWTVAESVTDLPVWRPLYIDLRELTCFGDDCSPATALDLSDIRQLQIAVARCLRDSGPCEVTEEEGGVELDELVAVDLRPGGAHRLVQTARERVRIDPDLRAATAGAILGHQHNNGLVPAWFPEPAPNYNTFAEAVALLVFLAEAERTGDPRYREAASRLSGALVDLQLKAPAANAGAWMTAYTLRDNAIASLDATCTGDESRVQDVDRCAWVGNTAWATLALARAVNAGIAPDLPRARAGVAAGAAWMAAQVGRISAYPALVTEGLEGNVSTYFGLAAAGRTADAAALGEAIRAHGWDPVERRLKIGARPQDFATAMDMAGSWGAQFLRHIGRPAEALASQGFAATVLRTRTFDGSLAGYGDIAGPWTLTVEFGAQAAAAGILGANEVMSGIYPLMRTDGSFPGGADEWYGGTVAPWTTTMTGVAPTAWVYFAQNGDPLEPRARRRSVR
ncbi:MAG TPA: hypothetical protein VEK57_06865 [Thermoanaerobaculia bacterium]|nr:hypothetical protein [Thermoanaerobaculia bacterium]